MDAPDALALLDDTTRRIGDLIGAADLTTPAERLGRWRAHDVVSHLGGVHEWATRVLRTSSLDGPGFRKSKLRGPELAAWYPGTASDLLDALRSVDPDGECPNFNPGSAATNSFWLRRQLHESLVHAYDLERVLGEATPISPVAATDGIDEYLDVFIRTRGKQTLTAPLTLRSTDTDASWTLAPADKAGRVDTDADSATSVAGLAGPAESVLLVLWNRLTVNEAGLSRHGDERVIDSFRA